MGVVKTIFKVLFSVLLILIGWWLGEKGFVRDA